MRHKHDMRCVLMILAALAICVARLLAQDADTIILKNDSRKFTILSQIQDPNEAAAFMAVLNSVEPAARYKLANDFLSAYPQSWLLPQAFDAAARSAIDLAKYDDALAAGRFSLRLLPENPSLLILLANIEAQKNLFDRAIQGAGDALEYLDEIERPPNMNQTEWDVLEPQLKASAYFAKGRAESSRAHAEDLQKALADLNRAAAWNSDDAEVFYLRAIVELRLQQKTAAASDLAFVLQTTNPLREKAQTIFSVLSKQMSLDAFLMNVPARIIDKNLRAEQRQTDPQVLAYGYAGPEACCACHATEYQTWRQTGMARMFRPYRAANIAGDFSPGTEYSENPDLGTIRMGTDKRPYFEFSSHGSWQRFYIDFTIGSKWQQGYATKLPDGRVQVFPIEYNLLQKKWINYWKIIDPPGSPRAVIQDFPKLTSATNYQQNCAICHTSQLKVDASANADSMEHAVYLQPGIDCEMCHGPAAWHVKDPTQPPFDFHKASNRDAVRVCAQCHRQSSVREIGEGGEMNYSTKGNFIPATWLRPYDAFSRKAFFKDGRFRETTFIVESFTRSACYLRGTAQCATCHSPHLANFDNNLTSLKYWDKPNEMCLSCHAQYRNRIAEHSHHAVGSEASQCVSCHMPRIVNALLFKARSHQIEIPSADLTERFGQQDSPNVCLTCHSEKSAGWAKDQLTSWRD
jgi:predicted CXXCH cytochrome family protein